MASLVSGAAVESLRPLLEFIYAGEGGYDSYNRGVAGDSPDPYPNGGLQKLSIAQVMAKQGAGELFAVGAAQFIPETLRMAVDAVGVDITEKFTAANQDRLAVALLIGGKRPKLAAYLQGKGTDLAGAQLDLAKEWASIPGPDGRGFYDGDSAGNRATQKVLAVQAALRAGREGLNAAVLFRLEAVQDTWLKREPVNASELSEHDKVIVTAQRSYSVIQRDERAADAHAQIDLAFGAGTWWIYEPHWRTVQEPAPAIARQIDWSDFNAAVEPNLTVGEILQWDKRRVPSTEGMKRTLRNTAREFQQIRSAWDKALGVTSFYRPEPINAQVGGVRGSRHTTGEAFDVYPVNGSLDQFYNWLRPRWSGGLGDGRDKGFVHCDTRNGGHFSACGSLTPTVEWDY